MHRYNPHGQNLDGFSDVLKKVRKKVHSIFPRELSPTRMIEKWGTDQKKKSDAKIAKIHADSAAASAAIANTAPAAAISQLAASASGPSPLSPMSAPVPSGEGLSPWILPAALGVGALALLLMFTGKKK